MGMANIFFRSDRVSIFFDFKMIRLIFGNPGSGKTASAVRYMKMNPHKNFITNIDVRGKDFRHVIKLTPGMILKRDQVGSKRNGRPIFNLTLNSEFWKEALLKYKALNVIIDEAHIFFNPRRSMSKINLIMTDFLALLRRVLGTGNDNGELILISQLSRRLDVIAKEMSTSISFCLNHYTTRCSHCHSSWSETNETPDPFLFCPRCKSYKIKRVKNIIEVFDFRDIDHFMSFKELKSKTYFRRYIIKDIETIFGNYDTLQFDDLLSGYEN